MDKNIHVALIEDDHEIRETLALIIDETEGFQCKHQYGTAEDAVVGISDKELDVILVDIDLPGDSGIECVKILKEKKKDLDFLMLTVKFDDDSVFDSLCAGAAGYLTKETPPAEILKSIQEVFQGGSPMSRSIARKIVTSFQSKKVISPLTKRETEILDLLCRGMNYRTIADQIFLSGHTIKSHIKNIYSKLHVNSRAEAVSKAYKDKLI